VGFVGVGAAILVPERRDDRGRRHRPERDRLRGRRLERHAHGRGEAHSDVLAIAFGGTGGVVAVGGQVVVVNDTSRQKAHVDTGAKLGRAGGGITVSARAERDEYTLGIGVGLGLVAAGAAISILNVHGDTVATIGNVPVGADACGRRCRHGHGEGRHGHGLRRRLAARRRLLRPGRHRRQPERRGSHSPRSTARRRRSPARTARSRPAA
jgi:hypothetical protein